MDESLSILFVMVEVGGVLAPIVFIFFHIFRQFLFIPVSLVCMAGGMLFGAVFGTIFSLLGLLLSSICFYFVIKKLPKTSEKLSKLRRKWFGEYRNVTVAQSAILRLIPFIHFHLLNFCLLEKNRSFNAYLKSSVISNLPLAFFYSVFGQFIREFTPPLIAIILFSLILLAYLFRERATVIKWEKFFNVKEG
jgi:uncharacterized membrane protein YdjX (TVP38/TMEM64 family)